LFLPSLYLSYYLNQLTDNLRIWAETKVPSVRRLSGQSSELVAALAAQPVLEHLGKGFFDHDSLKARAHEAFRLLGKADLKNYQLTAPVLRNVKAQLQKLPETKVCSLLALCFCS
jgi:hypothetical protein